MSKAYLETTVLTNLLSKPSSAKEAQVKAALPRYEETLLPVYSIKEWKAGPLDHYAYVHDKLVQTHSLAATLAAINSLNPLVGARRKTTSIEALEAAARLSSDKPEKLPVGTPADQEIADRYRLALASLVIRSWEKRRRVATKTIQDLECYTEAVPRFGKGGLLDLMPKECSPDRPCCLWDILKLKTSRDRLIKLRGAIPETSDRYEDKQRRKVLKQLINNPKIPITREQCRWLGDAVFAFFCPDGAIILTTNIGDHQRLARSIGKRAEKP